MRNVTTQANSSDEGFLAQVKALLLPRKTPKISFVDFMKTHELKTLRTRRTQFNKVRVSVTNKQGKEIYAYGDTFHLAMSELSSKFS